MRLLRGVEAVHLSLFDVKNLCKDVKSILLCPLWLQTYVSIVHRPTVRKYSSWNRHITYDVLLIFPRFLDEFKSLILCSLCYKGDLHELIKIHDRFEWSHDDARIDGNMPFRWACEFGHIDTAKWLYTTFQLTVDDARSCNNMAFRLSRQYGHQNVCDWLVTTFGNAVKP